MTKLCPPTESYSKLKENDREQIEECLNGIYSQVSTEYVLMIANVLYTLVTMNTVKYIMGS